MDTATRSVVRKLVTNKTIEDFDYINTKFAFKTVYNVSKYTYRCCPCGFEHEYLDYIGKDGEINEEMYEKIVKSIFDGQCPHVTDVNKDDTAETGIYGIAIALALGTEIHCDKDDLTKDKFRSALFNVDPFMLAIKKNLTSLKISVTDYYRDSNKRMWDAQRSTTNIHEIILVECDALELCISNKNVKLLEEMPVYGNVGYCALRSAFHSCSEQMINAVLQKIDLTNQRTEVISSHCCLMAIIFDRPDILRTHLGRFSSTFHIVRKDLEHMLTTYCKVLRRPRCKDVISKYNKYDEKQLTISELVINKLWLLLDFYDDVNIRDEILSSLQNIKRENLTEFKKEEFLQIYSMIRVDIQKKINSAAFKTVLNEAAELFALPQNDISHLDSLLEKRYSMSPAYRQVLEILLFENPELDGNWSLLTKCLEVDNDLELCDFVSEHALHTSLIMDCKQHAMFKHDNARDFALNFTAPLLIECGCPYSSDEYLTFISRYGDGRLQQAEEEFLCQIKDTQKTLAGMCRDTLRRHFKGPQIHGYVKQSNIPSKIKNFILLKDVLKCTPVDVFY